jgi:2'-5' RNA ligase
MKQSMRLQEFISDEELREINHLLPCEYLLVLQPNQSLWDKITAIKKKFEVDYRFKDVKVGLPHITLAMFKQFKATENRIVQSLRNNAKTLSPFIVELKDFGSFPSHTIYINIVSKVPIINAVKTLRQAAQRFMKIDKDNKPFFITEPHLTIARKLQPWQYEKGWLEYQHANFDGRFIADHALLLRRKAGETYRQIEKFTFEGIKEEVTQTALFNL